ncbi:MAG: hypothetical protein AAF829_06630 [Pseudomonadota bacterium]
MESEDIANIWLLRIPEAGKADLIDTRAFLVLRTIFIVGHYVARTPVLLAYPLGCSKPYSTYWQRGARAPGPTTDDAAMDMSQYWWT